MLPKHLASLFWDANIETFVASSYPDYTISRVLEYGDEEAIRWLLMTFSEKDVVDVLRRDRHLSPRSANFWALRYHLAVDDVAALRRAA
jgi:hypothetical protein